MDLNSQYATTKTIKKRPFNKEEIMSILIGPPLNVDNTNIIETRTTIGVMMPKKEYIEKKIGAVIMHVFDTRVSCTDDAIVFIEPEHDKFNK